MKKEVIIYFTGKLIPALVTLFIIVLVVRTLGEVEYGRYSLVFYASMLVSTLTFGWIQQSTLRFLTAYKDELETTINRLFHLTILSSVAAVLIMLPVCIFYFKLTWIETGIVLLYVFLYNFYFFNLTLNQAQTKPLRYAILEGSFNLLYIGILSIFLFVVHVKWFAIIFVSMSLGLVFAEMIRISMPASHKYPVNLANFYWDPDFTRRMLDFGFTLTIWLFLSNIVTIADRFIISEFFSYKEVGVYSAVKDIIVKVATFVTAPVILAYHPNIVKEWNEGNKEKAGFMIRESTQVILLELLLVFVAFIFLQDILYQRILHLSVHIPRMISGLLLGSAFLWQLAMIVHKPLELLLKQRLMLIIILIVMILNIALNLILVPFYGLTAAAFSAFLSSLMYILIVILFIIRNRWHKEKIS
ncbi:MAG: oligosaccharide flippase family protein [Bacteroidota bacterium]|nr:oligosaccharide flippase family protein [Bacteroidota bacterium]